ncbi:MAG TPA: A/G-specific adenine glycosylase [Flavitalea sp.]|nr:A/G-specific adenine glycosylase [Flavitalea sp.]
MKADFTRKLLKWNAVQNRRIMPWKGEKDPYKIWLSEIMLQQTRVEQGIGYYERFIKAFPTVFALAKAPEKQVYKMWEGLGYYSRCKNLIHTARTLVEEHGGKFPSAYEEILKLKGIGPYTAAAIASFAFNECRAVVDGNVLRVISRYFGVSTPIDDVAGKKIYHSLAGSLIDPDSPGTYNQAIMDFGATICKPRSPLCGQCVQSKECEAFRHGYIEDLPVKSKSLKKKARWFYYFLIEIGDGVYIRKRTGKDIWQNLHEFVCFETDGDAAHGPGDILKKMLKRQPFIVRSSSEVYTQQLTHQQVHGRFIRVTIPLPGGGPEEDGKLQGPGKPALANRKVATISKRHKNTATSGQASDRAAGERILSGNKNAGASGQLRDAVDSDRMLLEKKITKLLARADEHNAQGAIGYQLVKKNDLHEYAFPKLLHAYLKQVYPSPARDDI